MRNRFIVWLYWALVSLGALALYSVVRIAAGPLPLEIHNYSFLHLLRTVLAVLLIVTLPGILWTRIFLSKRHAGTIQVLGSGLAFNALFFVAVIQGYRLLDFEVNADSLMTAIQAATIAGLVLLGVTRTLDKHLLRRKTTVLQISVGLLLAVLFVCLFRQDLLRPSFRFFFSDDIEHLITQPHNETPHLVFAEGFQKQDDRRYSLVSTNGVIELPQRQAGDTIPIRLLMFGPSSLQVQLDVVYEESSSELDSFVLGQRRTLLEMDHTYFAKLPPYAGTPIIFDLPAQEGQGDLLITVEGTALSPINVEDYSNLTREAGSQLFEERNTHTNFLLMAEHFSCADRIEKSLNIYLQPPIGYYFLDLAIHLGGRTTFSLNLLYLVVVLIAYLVACEILSTLLEGKHRLCLLLFPASAMWVSWIAIIVRSQNGSDTDGLYTVFLLIAILLLMNGRTFAFLAASIPASMVRFPGIVLLGVFQIARIFTGPGQKDRVRTLLVFTLFWTGILLAIGFIIWISGDWTKQMDFLYFETFTEHFDPSVHPPYFGEGPSRNLFESAGIFLAMLLYYSCGFSLMLLAPREAFGKQILALVAFYTATLMFVFNPSLRYFLPLIFLSAIGAAWNLLPGKEMWRRRLLVGSISVSSILLIIHTATSM